MRQIYVLLFALTLPLAQAQAGSKFDDAVTGVTWTGGLFPHFSNQGKGTTGSNSRLVAKTFLKFGAGSFVPVDSVTYRYSNGRGGATKKDEPNNDENILFDESQTYVYSSLNHIYNTRMYRVQEFNSDNLVQRLTYRNWRDLPGGGGGWKDSARYSYLYSNGIMTGSVFEMSTGGLWNKHVQSVLIYDSKNNVTQMNSTSYVATFSYDNNNNLVSVIDSLQTHGGTWVLNQKKNYTYDAAGNVAAYTLEKWDASAAAWIKDSRWEYEYVGKNIVASTETRWNGQYWENTTKHLYNYDTNNNKTEDITQQWDAGSSAFANAKKQNWVYNIYNQPERITSQSWTGNNWSFNTDDEELRFYYEYYFPTNVQNTAAGGDEIMVYPTIAGNEVHIKAASTGAGHSMVALYDMNGRLLRNQPMNAAELTLNVSDLMSGNYIIKVTGEQGIYTSRIIVNH